jgi:hypothetical protein
MPLVYPHLRSTAAGGDLGNKFMGQQKISKIFGEKSARNTREIYRLLVKSFYRMKTCYIKGAILIRGRDMSWPLRVVINER